MKSITQLALIGAALQVLIQLFYLLNNALEFFTYNPQAQMVLGGLSLFSSCTFVAFFYQLYQKQVQKTQEDETRNDL